MEPAGSVHSGLIALRGEAGYQPDVLRGGMHFFLPFQYRVHSMPLVTIPQGKIGYIFARDGEPLPPTQTLARTRTAPTSRTSRPFLANGGQTRPAAPDPARGHLRHQPRPVRRAHRRPRLLPAARDERRPALLDEMATLIAERDGFEPVVHHAAPTTCSASSPSTTARRSRRARSSPRPSATTRRARRPTTTTSRTPSASSPPAAAAAASSRCWSRAPTTSTACSPRSSSCRRRSSSRQRRRGRLLHRRDGNDLSGDDYRHGELVEQRRARRLERAAAARQVRVQHYAGKVIMVPTTNFILKWNRGRDRRPPVRREPVRGRPDHQGRVRAEPAAVGGRAHRLPQGAARHPALRRRQEAGRADARPDGQRLLQERRPDAHADPAAPGPRAIQDQSSVRDARRGSTTTTSSSRRC